jgi:hypothetical protein
MGVARRVTVISMEFSMTDQTNTNQSPADRAGSHEARTKDNPTGVNYIGLPSGIPPEDLAGLDRVKPDPTKVENKS